MPSYMLLHMPQPTCSFCSSSVTANPSIASRPAVTSPPMPPPTTIARLAVRGTPAVAMMEMERGLGQPAWFIILMPRSIRPSSRAGSLVGLLQLSHTRVYKCEQDVNLEKHEIVIEIVMGRYSGLIVGGSIALGTLGLGALRFRYPQLLKQIASFGKPRARPRVVLAASKGEFLPFHPPMI